MMLWGAALLTAGLMDQGSRSNGRGKWLGPIIADKFERPSDCPSRDGLLLAAASVSASLWGNLGNEAAFCDSDSFLAASVRHFMSTQGSSPLSKGWFLMRSLPPCSILCTGF